MQQVPVEGKVCRAINHSLFFVSCLAELHISASIAAASTRKPRYLQLLGQWLPAIWPMGAVYGIIAAVRLVDGQAVLRDVSHSDPVGASIVLVCFAMQLVLYLVSLQASIMSCSPDVVVTRMRRRAMVYPAIFVVTSLPTCARYFEAFTRCSTYGKWSIFAEVATGTLNALAFAVLSREPSSTRSSHDASGSIELSTMQAVAPKVVGFNKKLSIREIADGGSFRNAGQWQQGSTAIDIELEEGRRQSTEQSGEET